MTQPGPKPLPRNLRILRGMRDQAAEKPAAPIPEPPVHIPSPPDDLSPEEMDVFVDRARLLARMRVMTDADVDLLVIYVRNWVDAQKARRAAAGSHLVRTPSGYVQTNPNLVIARAAEDRCVKIMTEFGITPSSRNRVSQ